MTTVTAVAFHFGAPDKLAYACRLLRKAAATGARVMLVGKAQDLQRLDTALWGVTPQDFVTHAQSEAKPAVRDRSSVLLGTTAFVGVNQPPILVNMADDIPDGFVQFDRVIEIVSTDEADRNLARLRWKHYAQLGIAITRHDLQLKAHTQ